MFEGWKLQGYMPGEGLRQAAYREDFDDSGWLDTTVPGDVHRTLIDAGQIVDPFYDQNELKCAWIEEREWWYRAQFDGVESAPEPDERLILRFNGLDTFVTIWLNGEELGQHENMFRPAEFDVTDKIRVGAANTLALCFDLPLNHVDHSQMEKLGAWGRNPERVFMRKGQFGFGWDWGPRLPTVGVWRDVELVHQARAALNGVHFATLAINQEQNHALVSVAVGVERFATDDDLTVHIQLFDPADENLPGHRLEFPADKVFDTAYIRVDSPELWWTHDLGEPALYRLLVELIHNGAVIDSFETPVGIRMIELDQSLDVEERGTRFFRFVLNGTPIFARGANWIPLDSFFAAAPEEQYANLLSAAQNANMNIIRIWGGGIYERDVFYRLCNQLGLLVWQDFMFACAMYPEDDAYAAEVEAEATYQVKRLRNHPCMALWCGNNENQWLHERIYWNQPDYIVPGARYYHDILPRVVNQLDGHVPYWFGSPFGGSDHAGQDDGNRHNWEAWHGNSVRRFGEEPGRDFSPAGVTYERYAEDMGRFISEFGLHAAPVMETIKRAIPEDQRYHHSPSMDHHNKDNPKNKGDNLLEAITGLPDSLEEYIDLSMIAQAEGLRFGIEHFRRRKPHCSGTIVWQLNDCWPVLSWSLIDYYGFGKAGYYFARRVFSPVLASFKQIDAEHVGLWIINDRRQPVNDQIQVKQVTFTGETLWHEDINVSLPANTTRQIQTWQIAPETTESSLLIVSSANSIFPTNRHRFQLFKDLRVPPAQPTVSFEPIDAHTVNVTLESATYIPFVYLIVPDERTVFEDNYFDLFPGEARRVRVSNPQIELNVSMISVHFR